MKTAVLLAAMLLVSCAKPPVPAALACEPVDGVDQVLAGAGVFVGDMHGTRESPAFLRALACHAAGTGRPVVVAMEYSATEQPVLDEFLGTSDAGEAERLLTSTPFWTGNTDGRASGAMRDALLHIHRQVHAGRDIGLLAYDLWGSSPQERETLSARRLREQRLRHPANAYWIIYGGNVHARKTRGLPFIGAPADSGNHETLGYLIRDFGLVHLNAMYRGGAFWGCQGENQCSPISVGPPCTADCPTHAVIRLQASDPAYDGVYDVGTLSVSPPLLLR